MMKVLLAGGTGYLGSYILSELLNRGFYTKAIVRNENKLSSLLQDNSKLEIVKAELTQPDSIKNCCKGVDIVISTVGRTKQKGKFTHLDIDYQANLNLLNEAVKQGVKKFIYISVIAGDKLRNIAVCDAKEKFVDELKQSGLQYCVVRPNGFFSDMAEFFKMAQKGRVYLFGTGELKLNPIHGEDLAELCVNQIESDVTELNVGGPETFTHKEIAEMAFQVIGEKPKITYIPNWLRKFLLKLGRLFMSKYKYGSFEFFMNAMAIDMIAPKYGKHTLKEHFEELNKAKMNK